jgi:hypothetical protein
MSKMIELMDQWLQAKSKIEHLVSPEPDLLDFEFEITKAPLIKAPTSDYYAQILAEKKLKEAEEELLKSIHQAERIDWDRVKKNRSIQYQDISL